MLLSTHEKLETVIAEDQRLFRPPGFPTALILYVFVRPCSCILLSVSISMPSNVTLGIPLKYLFTGGNLVKSMLSKRKVLISNKCFILCIAGIPGLSLASYQFLTSFVSSAALANPWFLIQFSTG